MRTLTTLSLSVLLLAALGACSEPKPSLEGVWFGDDGTTKTVSSGGACSGMYYNQGKVLDIGGPMTCTLSEDGDRLVVRQPPNERTYTVRFVSDGELILMDSAGESIVTLTRS